MFELVFFGLVLTVMVDGEAVVMGNRQLIKVTDDRVGGSKGKLGNRSKSKPKTTDAKVSTRRPGVEYSPSTRPNRSCVTASVNSS